MQKEENGFLYYIYPIIMAFAIAVGVAAIFLFVLSFVMQKVDIPLSATAYLLTAISGLCVFVGSFFSGKKFRSRGLFLGICTGLLFFTVMLLLSAATQPMGLGMQSLFKAVICLLGGATGGVLGVNFKEKALQI